MAAPECGNVALSAVYRTLDRISRLQDMRIYLDGHGPPQQMDRDDEQVLLSRSYDPPFNVTRGFLFIEPDLE